MNVLKRVKDSASFYYNCPKKSSTTIFSETLRYDSPTRGTAARYAGGLSEVMTLQGSTRNTYGFTYDAAGRLTTAKRFTETSGTSSSAAYTERGITYNRNGALLTLQRYGSSASTPQDDYSYTYSGQMLTGVSGKDDGSSINASFSHDGNGNMTADGRANLTFTYNLLNLPETVTSGNTQMATYHWLSDGTKYKVTAPAGNGVIYAGDLTYTATVSGGNTTYILESAEANADGTARFLKNGTAMTPYYTIRDHLGSVRTIVNASGTVVERNDYYPFGSRTTFGTSYATLSSNRLKFSGKEDQTTVAGSTIPYLDFGARMYDAKLVRWNTYDPMAEKYYGINPYVYCAGDPVNLVDPEGTHIWTINQNGEVLNKKKDKSQDAFVLVDEKGQQVCFISFKYKTVKSVKKHTKIRVGETEKEISTILLSNTEAGADLFKLFADNSDKEYGFITMKNENSLVMTSHEPSSIPISLKAKELDRKWETKVTRIIHSHPNNTPPSGYDQEYTGRGDKTGAGLVKKAYHYVYQPGTGLLIPYDNKEIKPSIKWEIVFPKSIIK